MTTRLRHDVVRGDARPQHGRWLRAVGALTAALVLAGCGGIDQQTVGAGDDAAAFFVHGPQLPSAGTNAEITGALTIGDGCVLLEQDGNAFPVVWPSGTSFESAEPLVILLPTGEQLREGENVRGGGGYPYADTLDIDVPEACLNVWGEVAVFNPDDEPQVVPDGGEPAIGAELRCDDDLVESAIYDYGKAPPPDGPEPLEAVEAFFGDGVPEDADLDVEGREVHVTRNGRVVATIRLMDVPGGWVVDSYDACAGTIVGP